MDLKTGVFQIGRTPDNDIIIDHNTISRVHAELTVSKDHLRIKDLHSSSGTRLNGKSCSFEKKIRTGDTILLGLVNLTIGNGTEADMPHEKTRMFQEEELSSVLQKINADQPVNSGSRSKPIIIGLCLLILTLCLYIWQI